MAMRPEFRRNDDHAGRHARDLHADDCARSQTEGGEHDPVRVGSDGGVGQAGAQGDWVGILIHLAALGAAIAVVAGMAGAFAEGGLVTGPGGPKSDSLLARLSAGEYALNAGSVRHYGQPTLEAMNRRILTVQGSWASSQSASPEPSVPSMPAPETARQALNLVPVDRRNQAREFLESSEGETRILYLIRRRRLEIG